MTREIALHCMKSASELERELCEECPIYGQTGCDHCYEDALQYVIAMLEQESVLDKVRAEIEHTEIVYDKSTDYKDDRTDAEKAADLWKMDKLIVLGIIDKYKGESEIGDGKV